MLMSRLVTTSTKHNVIYKISIGVTMLNDILTSYGIFILEILTILLLILAIVGLVISYRQHNKSKIGELEIKDLSEEFDHQVRVLHDFNLSEEELKQQAKAEKKAEKQKAKKRKEKLKRGEILDDEKKSCVYVLDFHGDISASETTALREEISAILNVAKPEDEVLLRLESPGGIVHDYGFAASQLSRLKQKGIKLTIAVDKVAASGGYMMACVADKIVSAPFAIIGSIGVVAQIPNVHRLLKKYDVDVDVMTAGEFKRTVTVLGENTEKGKQKFQQELEETHQLFKQFVSQNRPCVDIDKIATGEHWFGQQAIDLKLVDEISTSDDLILEKMKEKHVLSVKYRLKKSLIKKLGHQAEESAVNIVHRYATKRANDFIH